MIKDTIQQDLTKALKEKDQVKSSLLRFINSEIKNEEIAKKKRDKGLSDEEVQKVIARQLKQIKDSIESFKAGKRDDLVKEEEQKVEILSVYLPEQMSEQELEKIIDQVIKDANASSVSDFGKVMGQVMAKTQGKADGQKVNELVKKKLSS